MARKIKDSNVDWIGKIPEAWNVSRLKYIGQYVNGYAFKPDQWGNKGRQIIRIQDLTGSNNNPNYYDGEIDSKYIIKNGDILVSWAATLAAFIWNKGEGLLNQHIFKATNNPEVVTKDFFFWLIKVAMEYMNNENKHGIVMQHVTLDVFDNFRVAIPPIDEQQTIASFLDTECSRIDAVIDQTRASIEEYKKLKQAVITQAVTKGIRPGREMKDSKIDWIGDIPCEWTITKVKHVASLVTDGAHVSPETENGVYDFISTVNISNDIIDFKNCLKTSEKSYVYLVSTGCKPQAGDVLISKDGTVGKTAIVKEDRDFVVASSLVIIRPKRDKITPEFLNYSLQNKVVQDTLLLLMHGAGLKRVSVAKNANLTILLPDLVEQNEIVRYLDEKCIGIDNIIIKKEQYLSELETYKRSLIYEYVTGKKEVPACQ